MPAAVLVSNALANGDANVVLSPAEDLTVGRAAAVVIAALAVALLVPMPRLWSGR